MKNYVKKSIRATKWAPTLSSATFFKKNKNFWFLLHYYTLHLPMRIHLWYKYFPSTTKCNFYTQKMCIYLYLCAVSLRFVYQCTNWTKAHKWQAFFRQFYYINCMRRLLNTNTTRKKEKIYDTENILICFTSQSPPILYEYVFFFFYNFLLCFFFVLVPLGTLWYCGLFFFFSFFIVWKNIQNVAFNYNLPCPTFMCNLVANPTRTKWCCCTTHL